MEDGACAVGAIIILLLRLQSHQQLNLFLCGRFHGMVMKYGQMVKLWLLMFRVIGDLKPLSTGSMVIPNGWREKSSSFHGFWI